MNLLLKLPKCPDFSSNVSKCCAWRPLRTPYFGFRWGYPISPSGQFTLMILRTLPYSKTSKIPSLGVLTQHYPATQQFMREHLFIVSSRKTSRRSGLEHPPFCWMANDLESSLPIVSLWKRRVMSNLRTRPLTAVALATLCCYEYPWRCITSSLLALCCGRCVKCAIHIIHVRRSVAVCLYVRSLQLLWYWGVV